MNLPDLADATLTLEERIATLTLDRHDLRNALTGTGLVEDIGVKTRQSQLDKEAGQTLLAQSSNQRESVSGVNLDEEAGKLIQYQAAYNASAQVMSVAQDLFNTLLQSFR